LWFKDYNIHHPHKGLKMRSPKEYRMMQDKLERGVRFDGGKPTISNDFNKLGGVGEGFLTLIFKT